MFSDQLATVISGLYGHDIAEVVCLLHLLLFTYIHDLFLYSMRISTLIVNVLIVNRC